MRQSQIQRVKARARMRKEEIKEEIKEKERKETKEKEEEKGRKVPQAPTPSKCPCRGDAVILVAEMIPVVGVRGDAEETKWERRKTS